MSIDFENILLDESEFTAEQYNALRHSVGWHTFIEDRAEMALRNSVYTIKVVLGSDLIGMGRIVGDGGVYFYIHDVIVLKDYRGMGIGTMIMKKLMAKIHALAPEESGAFVGLMISPGLQKFYRKFDFEAYPDDSPGMCIWKTNIHKRIR